MPRCVAHHVYVPCAELPQLAGKPVPPPDTTIATHEEVIAVGQQKAEVMRSLIEKIVELIPKAQDV